MSSASLPMDIFEILRRNDDAYYNAVDFQSPKTDLSLCQWVPEVTHVCHSWREAALFASFLWTYIDVEASPLWAEFARRSRQCPINVILESYPEDQPLRIKTKRTLDMDMIIQGSNESMSNTVCFK